MVLLRKLGCEHHPYWSFQWPFFQGMLDAGRKMEVILVWHLVAAPRVPVQAQCRNLNATQMDVTADDNRYTEVALTTTVLVIIKTIGLYVVVIPIEAGLRLGNIVAVTLSIAIIDRPTCPLEFCCLAAGEENTH
jgi:hypothetical protein